MQQFLFTLGATLGTGFDLLLVILGFGLIVFLHELGHFVAARWAGIRVLAFAVGFGPALFSYRKGMGLRKGSSADEYQKLAEAQGSAVPGRTPLVPGVSPTEYRLNILPFGGYVKMLGQDDADPSARSAESDGYQGVPVWKRMIVISAGVTANLIVAALLFIAVFMLGLPTEPAIVGSVAPGSPAATTVATNAKQLGITEPGLRSGDVILTIDHEKPDDFSEVVVSSAMARKGSALHFEVKRPGVADPLVFDITPREDPASRLLQIGVGPATSGTLVATKDAEILKTIDKIFARGGLAGAQPGMVLTRVGDTTGPATFYDIQRAAAASNGAPFEVAFAPAKGNDSPPFTLEIKPRRQLQEHHFVASKDREVDATSFLGLMPVLNVVQVVEDSPAAKAGLLDDDVFVQLGGAEWPSYPEGIAEITRNKNHSIRVVVRRTVDGARKDFDLGEVPVDKDGRIGFLPGESWRTSTRVTAWPSELLSEDDRSTPRPASEALALMRGTRILSVEGRPVANFVELAEAVVHATADAFASGAPSATVSLAIELPVKEDGAPAVEPSVPWTLSRADLEAIHSLGWVSPVNGNLFERAQIVLRADGPVAAIGMGLRRTHRVMMQTYLTFSRLWQGSVKVEHLKGPIGIAQIGTVVASRGYVHLLFFLALISVNLAVVNFLPIPIADGGHFVFLLYEQITGRPVSILVQNIATIAGLVLIAGVFLLVTYNDLRTLLGLGG